MRIAYLSSFYPLRGGIAQFNASLLEALQEAGHDCLPLSFSRQYPEKLFPGKTQFVKDGDLVKAVNAAPVLDSIQPISWMKTARVIRDWNPDILLTKYWMSFFAPSLGFVSNKLGKGVKKISILDNVLPHEKRFFDQPLTRYFLHSQDGFVVMSQAVERDLNTFRPDAPRLQHRHPVYNHFGVPPAREQARRELGYSDSDKVLLFYGFIRPYKGLDLLLEAFDQLDNSYRLMIAGESYVPFEPYQNHIDQSPGKDAITIRERYISDEETRVLFAAADACILPYKEATQSGIALIAYHFQLPMIASSRGGLGEYIRDGENGVLISRLDPEGLAQGVARYFDLGGRAAFAAKLEQFDSDLHWSHLADAIVQFAEKLP